MLFFVTSNSGANGAIIKLYQCEIATMLLPVTRFSILQIALFVNPICIPQTGQTMEMPKRFFRVPDDLWNDAKAKAKKEAETRDTKQITLSAIIRAALIAYIKDEIELDVKYGEVVIKPRQD